MSNREFENYLALLVRLMPVDAGERESIRDELRSHLEDRFEDLLTQKISRDEALRRTIDELGDAARLAAAFASLHRTQRRRRIMRFSSATLVVAVLALLALTAFWPDDPAGGRAIVAPPMAPSVVQAQTPPPVHADHRSKQSEIQQKLNQPVEAEFVETPLADVLRYLSDVMKVQFHLNRRALEEAGVNVEAPISMSLKDVRAETVLRLVLQSVDVDLDFVERDRFILVSTVEDLDRATEVRVYNCRDLLSLTPPMPGEGVFGSAPGAMAPGMQGAEMGGGGFGGGGGLGGLGAPGSFSPLSMLIQSAVESQSWELSGGNGSISEFKGLLVVKQSARVHKKIDDLLGVLRQAADLEKTER